MLKQWVAAVGVPQLIVMGVLVLMWGAEQWLSYTKRVKANSTMQAFFNALYAWAKLRYPLVARLGNIANDAHLLEAAPPEDKTTAGGGK
jgi:hypothetical protein